MLRRDKALREKELDAQILNTPLEQFAASPDINVEDLKKKYE
jgi:hypothetical protein